MEFKLGCYNGAHSYGPPPPKLTLPRASHTPTGAHRLDHSRPVPPEYPADERLRRHLAVHRRPPSSDPLRRATGT